MHENLEAPEWLSRGFVIIIGALIIITIQAFSAMEQYATKNFLYQTFISKSMAFWPRLAGFATLGTTGLPVMALTGLACSSDLFMDPKTCLHDWTSKEGWTDGYLV